MKLRTPWRRILLPILAILALVMSCLAVYIRIEDQKLAAQLQTVLVENKDRQLRQSIVANSPQYKQTVLLDAPITDKTALSFYWFGDMESHFRDPVNFYVVPDAAPILHKVMFGPPDTQANVFVTAEEMRKILDGLKGLFLRWNDSRGREVFKDTFHRGGTGMLDVTLVGTDATAKAHIRIAVMCDQLGRLDSKMPTPRILWQFRTFRWDNGCEIPGYDNSVVPAE
jgi:hypothetical protein